MDDDDFYEQYRYWDDQHESEEEYNNPPSDSELFPLHTAVRRRDIRQIKKLLKREGGYFGDDEGDYYSPLATAATGTDDSSTSILQILLDARPAPQWSDFRDESEALMMATWKGSVEGMEILINANADVDFDDCRSDIFHFGLDYATPTPLFVAAKAGSFEKVKLLLEAKASVENLNENGDTEADLAELEGHHDIVRLLAEAGAARNEWCQMRDSCIEGRTDDVKALIDAGYQFNPKTMRGKYPLIIAAKHGRTEILQLLIAAGAQINVLDEDDKTPLDHIIEYSNVDFAKELIAAKADTTCNQKRHSVLSTAAECGNLDATIMLLDTKGIRGTYRISKALPYAAEHGRLDIMRVLIDAKAHVDQCTLACAAKGGSEHAVKFLLDAKATLGYINSDCETPLYCAIENGHIHLLDLLFCPKTDKGPPLYTALRYATKSGNLDTMRRLIDAKAPFENPDLKKFYDSPLLVAVRQDNLAATRLLLDARAKVELPNTTYTEDLLWCAIKKAHADECNNGDVMKALLDANASLTVESWGANVLKNVYFEDSHSLVKLLLDYKAFADTVYQDDGNSPRYTLLQHAVEQCDAQMAKVLIEGKANVDFKPEGQDTGRPLMCAVELKSVAVLRTLIEGKASVDGNERKTPLSYAFQHWRDDDRVGRSIIEMLVEAKGSLGETDLTPLMKAAFDRKPRTLKMLTRVDPDSFDAQDENGMTALMYAIIKNPASGDQRIVKMLLEHAQAHCAAESAAESNDDEPPVKRFKTME